MIRTTEFQFASLWGLLLAVALPLAFTVLWLAEKRFRKARTGARPLTEPLGTVRAQAALLVLGLMSLAGGLLTCFWVLVATVEEPFESFIFRIGLGLLGAVVLLASFAVLARRRHSPVLLMSSLAPLKAVRGGRPGILRYLVPLLRLLAIALVILAVARPQVATTEADVFTEGMDIVMVLDVSTSMRAVDFAPPNRPRKRMSRIEGAKAVISSFIKQRTDDRLGLVVFAADAFTQSPLTLDYSILHTVLQSVKTGVIEDGTAIGNAIVVAINRMRESETKSKVIILLTDGDDNASKIAPVQAAEIAAREGIRVFPILVGKGGLVPYPVGKGVFGRMQYRKVEIRTDPALLKEIAKIAKGKFYRAVDQAKLEKDFQDILDQMEKTRLMDPGRYTRHTEVFQLALLPALLALLLELVLRWTRLRRFP